MGDAILHLFCGKIAAGKSTLAARIAQEDDAVLISEDDWLAALFADQLSLPKDYARCAGKLRKIMGRHVSALLNAGTSLVLDFPANTVDSRVWLREILEETGAEHKLHVLMPPDEECLARLRKRNAEAAHQFHVSEEQYWRFAKHFVPPNPAEGFTIIEHRGAQRVE
ncbi:MAG: ATP-binding protein [Pseudomonadota bacterium]